MLKKLAVVGVLLALTGCATHQQANTAVGAGVGAVVGHAIGGRGGAAVGAVVGTAIGSQHPTQGGTVYVERQIVHPRPVRDCSIYRHRLDKCNEIYSPVNRHYCRRDAETHYERCLYQ